MVQLALQLFGTFAARMVFPAGDHTSELHLPTDKTRGLLTYLALTPDGPLRREALAGVFWPDQPEAQARQNLRKTVARLRQALDAQSDGFSDTLLSVTRQTVTLHSAAIQSDVQTFLRIQTAVQKHAHGALAQCAACLAQLEESVALQQAGELLAGLSLADAAPFEAWLRGQREALHRQRLEAMQHLAVAYEEQGAYERAARFARQQINLEPWREAAHRQLMRLLAVQGRRGEAIAQYQACRALLRQELDVEPDAETEALLGQIMDGALLALPVVAVQPSPSSLPQLPHPLIGRSAEVEALLGLLGDPDCRILTLSGPGGMGKTSLAIVVAQQFSAAGTMPVCFVPLAEITAIDQLPAAVAGALGLQLHQRHSIAAQVAHYLRGRAMLLVLDNAEQLPLDAGWLRELSSSSPLLKLLITSRTPLGWQEEWRFPLQGLSCTVPASSGDAGQPDAVQLFLQAARRVQPDFRYTAESGQAIAQICRLVQGWPLALQMAAAWVRLMSCQAIAGQIATNLDLLSSSLRDIPARQRSMRVVFEQTWDLLSPGEKDVLVRLSVFPGSFSLPAAEWVADALLHILLSLVDSSLLEREPGGERYSLHPLLRQFAAEKGVTRNADVDHVRQRHCEFYLRALSEERAQLSTVNYRASLARIRTDIDNVRRAWLWAARPETAGENIALLLESVGPIATFYEREGLTQEAVALFRRTLAQLAKGQAGQQTTYGLLMAHVTFHLARSLGFMGRYAEASTAAQQAQAMAQESGDLVLANRALIGQADIWREQGHYEQAHATLREAITFSRAHDEPEGVARALRRQGNTYWSTGDYEAALACYEEARALHLERGQVAAADLLTGNIGTVYWRQERYSEALRNYEVALAARRSVGDASGKAIWLGNLGLLYVDLNDDERALRYLDEALAMHTQLGRKFYKIELLLGKTALHLRRGALSAAQRNHRQAVDIAQEIGNRAYLLDCDLWQARLLRAQGRVDEATQLLQLLLVREFRPNAAQAIFEELAAGRGARQADPGLPQAGIRPAGA